MSYCVWMQDRHRVFNFQYWAVQTTDLLSDELQREISNQAMNGNHRNSWLFYWKLVDLSPLSQCSGHTARLDNRPAHQARCHQTSSSQWLLSERSWKRPPRCPRSKWLDQPRSDNNLPLADLWRCAICWGHSAVMQTGLLPRTWSSSRGLTVAGQWQSTALFACVCKVALKMICNDFLVVKVNCWSNVFNIIKSIWILRNIKQ